MIDPRIAHYIRVIETPGIPYVSYSNSILWSIGCEHGHDVIAALIKEYFENKELQTSTDDV